MVARTIDNLGYDASERYAQDQKLLDGHEKITQDAKVIYTRTSIEVTKPIFQLETDLAFHGSLKNSSWAEFAPPLGYEEQKRFFTHELLPSFTNPDKTEALKKKILGTADKEDESGQEQDSSSKKENWQKIKEKEEVEKEKQVLINLLNCILLLDNCIIYMHGKRAQYYKG